MSDHLWLGANTKHHWAVYAPGTGLFARYRHCLVCNKVWRNGGAKPLLHNGRKPRR